MVPLIFCLALATSMSPKYSNREVVCHHQDERRGRTVVGGDNAAVEARTATIRKSMSGGVLLERGGGSLLPMLGFHMGRGQLTLNTRTCVLGLTINIHG